MRKIVLVPAFLFIAMLTSAQVEELNEKIEWTTIGQLKWMGITKAEFSFNTNGKDTAYWLFLKDERTLQTTNGSSVRNHYSIKFNNEGNAREDLKRILFSFFEKDNAKDKAYAKTFRLGSTVVNVQHYRKLTAAGIMFYTKEGYTVFNKRELTKLFGKADD